MTAPSAQYSSSPKFVSLPFRGRVIGPFAVTIETGIECSAALESNCNDIKRGVKVEATRIRQHFRANDFYA